MRYRSSGTTPPTDLAFSLLGPVRISRGGEAVPVRSLKIRALLALLLLHRGQPVNSGFLIQRIWDDPPPPTAVASARNMVSALRRTLGPTEQVSITTDTDGYVLNAPVETLDVTAFDALHNRGRALLRARSLDAAAEHLTRSLQVWQGPALMDLTLAGFAWPEVAALDERRLVAIDDLLRVDLARERYREVLIRVGRLTADHPGRESLHQAKVIALHRCGRRAEAASTYLDARRIIVEATGGEPSAAFRETHARILADEQTTVDSGGPLPGGRTRTPNPMRLARRSDGGSSSLIPRLPSASPGELAHEVRAVAVLCVRLCAPAAPDSMVDVVGGVIREYGGVVGEVRGSTLLSYFGLSETDSSHGACDLAVTCAVAVHRRGATLPGGTRFACVVTTGPIMNIVRANGPGAVTSWVAGEVISLCEDRAAQVPPGETTIF